MMKNSNGDTASTRQPAIGTLLAAASNMFAEKGYEGTSMRDLREATQVSIATLYHYFPSKDALFAEVCASKYDELVFTVLSRFGGLPRTEQTIIRLAEILYDVLTGDAQTFYLLQRDMINLVPSPKNFRAKAHYLRLRRQIDQTLGVGPDTPTGDMISFSFCSLIQGYCAFTLASLQAAEETEAHLRKHRGYLAQFVAQAFVGQGAPGSAKA